jgi:hypothetical protein
MAPGWHRGAMHISGEEGCARWGPQTSIEQIRARLRCCCCGHRGRRIVMEVWSPGGPSGGFEPR